MRLNTLKKTTDGRFKILTKKFNSTFWTKASNKHSWKKKFSLIFLIACLLAFLNIVAEAVKYSKAPRILEEIPLVLAEVSPVKVIPDEPGGLCVQNQDKLVYNTIENQIITEDSMPEVQKTSISKIQIGAKGL